MRDQQRRYFIVTRARINYRIRVKEVRTIDVDGKQLGVILTSRALKLAEEKELDLVEVAPNAKPPVCRIMDYGKYMYEQTKREKESHKRQHSGRLKEVRIRPRIEEHDYQVKLQQAIDFLGKRSKLKLSMFFRGREIVHLDLGMQLLKKFIDDLKDYGAVETPLKKLGKLLLVTLGPISKGKTKILKTVSQGNKSPDTAEKPSTKT